MPPHSKSNVNQHKNSVFDFVHAISDWNYFSDDQVKAPTPKEFRETTDCLSKHNLTLDACAPLLSQLLYRKFTHDQYQDHDNNNQADYFVKGGGRGRLHLKKKRDDIDSEFLQQALDTKKDAKGADWLPVVAAP